MKVVVKCQCGKVLHVPKKYSGKRGRCPQCARLLTVPHDENSSPPELASCPTCGAYISSGDEECVSCRTNLKTGDWDTQRFQTSSKFSWGKISLLSHLLLIFCILYLITHDKEKNTSSAKNTTESLSPENETHLLTIEEMPETNVKQTTEKIAVLEEFLQKQQSPWTAKTQQFYQKLREKHSLLVQQKKYQEAMQKELTLLQKWLLLQDISKKVTGTSLEKEVQQNIEDTEKELVSILHPKLSQTHHLLREQRHYEVVSRIVPEILKEFGSPVNHPEMSMELKSHFQQLIKICQNAKNDQEVIDPQSNSVVEQKKIKNYEKKFQQYLPKYYKIMYNRNYDEAQKTLENFWQLVNSLGSIDHKNALVLDIRDKLREVQSIKALFYIANEGAKKSIGIKKTFYLQNKKTMSGRIEKYVLGEFYIKDNEDREFRIPLNHLRSEDVVFFALLTEKNKYVYLYSGIFFCYENVFQEAKKAFVEALTHGGDHKYIQNYLQLCNRKLEEKRKTPKPK